VLGLAFVFTVERQGDALRTVGIGVFVAAAVSLYLTSTLYHALPGGRAKRVFQRLDHCTIYFMIAGTYTPFMLAGRPDAMDFALLAIVWGVATTGIVIKAIWGARWPRVSTACFLLLGWLSIFVLLERFMALPTSGVVWTITGGVAYTLGVAFFAVDGIRYAHFVWHLFVIAGTSSHAVVVWRYLS
jgi:hemolysin III